jgi:hypothetical protein
MNTHPRNKVSGGTLSWSDLRSGSSFFHYLPPTSFSLAKNKDGGSAFANFLLSSQGQSLLRGQGILTTPFTAGGDTTAIPQQLQQYVQS